MVVILIGILVIKGISSKKAGSEFNKEIISETEDLVPNETVTEISLKGSCNLIEKGSICIEYFGPYWMEEPIKLACKEGVYSSEGCPDNSLGGCHMNSESETDMISWYYTQGGGEFNSENIKYAMQSCNSVPGGVWTEE